MTADHKVRSLACSHTLQPILTPFSCQEACTEGSCSCLPQAHLAFERRARGGMKKKGLVNPS